MAGMESQITIDDNVEIDFLIPYGLALNEKLSAKPKGFLIH